MEYCLFSIGGTDYGVPAEAMREVLMRPPVRPVPLAPPVTTGLAGLRGEALPVFDWQAATGEGRRAGDGGRVLVLGRGAFLAGFPVDDTDRVFDPGSAPSGDDGLFADIRVAGRPVRLLNLSLLSEQLGAFFEPASHDAL